MSTELYFLELHTLHMYIRVCVYMCVSTCVYVCVCVCVCVNSCVIRFTAWAVLMSAIMKQGSFLPSINSPYTYNHDTLISKFINPSTHILSACMVIVVSALCLCVCFSPVTLDPSSVYLLSLAFGSCHAHAHTHTPKHSRAHTHRQSLNIEQYTP